MAKSSGTKAKIDPNKPEIFIASSGESREIVHQLQAVR